MFGISSFEFLVIVLVTLVVVGPEKMPRIIRYLTRLTSEFRRVKTDFHRTMNLELANLELSEPNKKTHLGHQVSSTDNQATIIADSPQNYREINIATSITPPSVPAEDSATAPAASPKVENNHE